MDRVWFVLLLVLLVIPPARAADAAPDDTQKGNTAPPEGTLDPASREAWGHAQLERLDQANAVVLDPQAVALQHARCQQMLQPWLDRTEGSKDAVARFQRELQISQRAAIEHLIRQYRMEVYDTFRRDRPEFDRRRAAMADLLAAWKDAGGPLEEQHKLIDWLQAALVQSTPGATGPLPAIPAFGNRPAESARVAQSKPIETVLEPKAERPRLPTILEPEIGRRVEATLPLPGPEPAEVSAQRRAMPAVRNVVARPALSKTQPVSPEPRSVVLPMLPARPAREPEAVARQSGSPVRRGTGSPAAPPSSGSKPARESVPKRPEVAPRPVVAPSAVARRPSRPSVASRPPATVQLPTDVSGSGSPSAENRPRALSDLPDEPAGGANRARINLRELAAQIAGNNLAMEKLTLELEQNRPWNTADLERALDQALPLFVRKDDLKLYYDALSSQDREQVGRLNSGSELVSALGARITQARDRLRDANYPGGATARRADAKRLEALSEKLSRLIFGDL